MITTAVAWASLAVSFLALYSVGVAHLRLQRQAKMLSNLIEQEGKILDLLEQLAGIRPR